VLKTGRAKTLALVVGLGLYVGTLEFLYRYLDDLANGRHGTFLPRLIEEGTGTLTALVLFPLVFELCRRFPWSEGRRLRALVAQTAGAICYSAAHTTLMALTRAALFPLAGLGHYDYGNMIYRYPMEMANDEIFYAVLVAIIYFMQRMRAARARELDAARLEAQLAQARLENLRLQLQPHFLFNTLNAISSVMYENPQAADTMIARLSDFLRSTLAASDSHETSLEEELRLTSLYADVMRARLENNLRLDCTYADDLRGALVPTLVLQPLVENAIVHGIPSGRNRIDIAIAARREGDEVVIRVDDDGVGPDAGGNGGGTGRGLANTRLRLAHLYGTGERFRIAARAGGGTEVELRIPYRVA